MGNEFHLQVAFDTATLVFLFAGEQVWTHTIGEAESHAAEQVEDAQETEEEEDRTSRWELCKRLGIAPIEEAVREKRVVWAAHALRDAGAEGSGERIQREHARKTEWGKQLADDLEHYGLTLEQLQTTDAAAGQEQDPAQLACAWRAITETVERTDICSIPKAARLGQQPAATAAAVFYHLTRLSQKRCWDDVREYLNALQPDQSSYHPDAASSDARLREWCCAQDGQNHNMYPYSCFGRQEDWLAERKEKLMNKKVARWNQEMEEGGLLYDLSAPLRKKSTPRYLASYVGKDEVKAVVNRTSSLTNANRFHSWRYVECCNAKLMRNGGGMDFAQEPSSSSATARTPAWMQYVADSQLESTRKMRMQTSKGRAKAPAAAWSAAASNPSKSLRNHHDLFLELGYAHPDLLHVRSRIHNNTLIRLEPHLWSRYVFLEKHFDYKYHPTGRTIGCDTREIWVRYSESLELRLMNMEKGTNDPDPEHDGSEGAGANKDSQSWSAIGQAPARGTTEKWGLALLQLSIFGSPPPPDSSWSKDLPFSVLLLNLDGALLNRWPWLVAEINATSQLPLLVVLSEADMQDVLWEKVLRLLQITLQHRYAIIRAARAVALVAHSLQLPAMKAPALVPGADDVMAIQIAHKDLSGEILVGYVSPTKNRTPALRALIDYVAANAEDLCLAAGDWNLSGGPVYEAQRRPGAAGRLWVELEKTKLTSVLPPDEPTFRGAETQPDILRIDWRGKAAPGPGSNGPVEVGGEPPPVPPGFRRRFKFEVVKATDQSLEKAAELCREALASGTFNQGTMEAALGKAGVPRSKSRRPPLPMPLIQDSGKLTTTSEEAADVFRARVMEGRPASLRRTPAEQREHDAEVEKLLAEAPGDPFEATWDSAYRARKRLNKNAAPGSDGVSARFLFVCDTLLLVLVQCICVAFNAFRDPPWSKTYLVSFLFKAKKKAASIFVPRFYRPVTLINVIDKLAEAVALEKLAVVLAVVADNFAYHAGWSPAAGLLRSLLYTLSSAAPYIGVIVGDAQGGFENAYLLHVLRVLAAKGAGRQLLKAIVSWFAGRTIIIMVDGLLSAATAISEGLGQGALLSPALFRIVIEEGMTKVGFRTSQTLAEVVTGFSDDLAIFCTAWSEAELTQKLQERGSQLLDMPYPVGDFRIALLRCPEDQDATDRRKRALARRLQVRLKNGLILTLPETWAQPEDEGITVAATVGGNAWHPETHISILGVPLTTNSAAWASWLEDQRRAVEITTTNIRSKLLDQDNKEVQSPLDLVDQYHQEIFSTLLYMASVKTVLCPWVLPAIDGVAEEALRKLLKVSATAPFYSTFISAGANVPSVAALAERKTNNTQVLGLDSEEYRTTMRVGDVFDHGWFGWDRALISLTNEAGLALPDNAILLTCADVCRRVGLSNKKVNTPEIARRIKAEFEELERGLGSALLWVATDSGDDPTDFDPSMRVGTIVMRYGHDKDADCAFALRLAHLFTTFIGEAGADISALTILDDSADVPEAPLNSPQLRYVVIQIDAAGVIDNLKSNIREQLWVRARVILARLGKRYEGKIVFVLHWVPGHSGISPHQHADEIQKTPGPRVPMEALAQPVVPLRQLRAFIRKELTKTVRRTVGIRGSRPGGTGSMRGIFTATLGCLRPLLRGLSPVQQEIVFSVLSGDGRVAAREVGSTVGQDFVVCGLCGQHVSAKTLSTQLSQFSQLADEVALPPASQPPAASPPDAAPGAEDADGDVAMGVDEGGAAAPAAANEAQLDEPELESDEDQVGEEEEAKRNILWCQMARHFVEGDCTKVVEWYSGADEEPVSPRASLKKPERLLRALLALAGHPAPDEWPVKKTAAPKRDEDPLREVELDNVSDAATKAAQVIEGHWVFPPATQNGPSGTQNPNPLPPPWPEQAAFSTCGAF
eukprot:g13964.t1